MAIRLSEMHGERKLFLGDFDPVKIKNNEITFEQIIYDLKLAALLYDRILIPAAYLWQSDLVGDKIAYFQDFISAGILIPTVRADDRDIKDRFDRRLDETHKFKNEEALARTPALEGELTLKKHQKVLERLKDQTTFIYLNEKTVSECLRRLWEKDIQGTFDLDVDTESLGIYIYENLPNEKARGVIKELLQGKDLEYISRTTLLGMTQICLDRAFGYQKWDKNIVERRISWLYLFATAKAADCELYINGFDLSNSLSYANLKLYMDTLKAVHITPEVLNSLSVDDIITIRNSKEHQRFIKFYQNLITNVKIASDAEVKKVIEDLNRESKIEKIQAIIPKIRNSRERAFGIASSLVLNCICGTPVNRATVGIVGAYVLMEFVSRVCNRTAVLDFQRYMEENFLKKVRIQ